MAIRRSLLLAVVAIAAITSTGLVGCTHDIATGTTGGPASSRPKGPTITAGGISIERTWIGPDSRIEDVAALRSGTVLGLLSTSGISAADQVVASADGGRTWTTHRTGLARGTDEQPMDYPNLDPAARLITAGDAVFATRPRRPADVGGWKQTTFQQVVGSWDSGRHWHSVTFPTSKGRAPLVRAAVASGRRIVAVGSTVPDDVVTAAHHLDYEHAMDPIDAAAWVSTDDGQNFAEASGPFDGVPGQQELRTAVAASGRFVAVGTTDRQQTKPSCCPIISGYLSYESSDGHTWKPVPGLEAPDYYLSMVDLHLEGRSVVIGPPVHDAVLAAHAHRWTWQHRYAPPGGATSYSGPGGRTGYAGDMLDGTHTIAAVDGGRVATWVRISGCDCSVPYAAHLTRPDPSAPTARSTEPATELKFTECQDTSVRGAQEVADPLRIGSIVAALGWCDHNGSRAAGIVSSTDDGRTWDTQRLDALVPPSMRPVTASGIGYVRRLAVRVGSVMVVLLRGGPDHADERPTLTSAPVVALRVTSTH